MDPVGVSNTSVRSRHVATACRDIHGELVSPGQHALRDLPDEYPSMGMPAGCDEYPFMGTNRTIPFVRAGRTRIMAGTRPLGFFALGDDRLIALEASALNGRSLLGFQAVAKLR